MGDFSNSLEEVHTSFKEAGLPGKQIPQASALHVKPLNRGLMRAAEALGIPPLDEDTRNAIQDTTNVISTGMAGLPGGYRMLHAAGGKIVLYNPKGTLMGQFDDAAAANKAIIRDMSSFKPNHNVTNFLKAKLESMGMSDDMPRKPPAPSMKRGKRE